MIELKPQTLALLDEIESRIDPEIEDDFRRQWSDFLHHRFTGDIFSPKRRQKSASSRPAGTYASTRRWTIWRPCFTRSF